MNWINRTIDMLGGERAERLAQITANRHDVDAKLERIALIRAEVDEINEAITAVRTAAETAVQSRQSQSPTLVKVMADEGASAPPAPPADTAVELDTPILPQEQAEAAAKATEDVPSAPAPVAIPARRGRPPKTTKSFVPVDRRFDADEPKAKPDIDRLAGNARLKLATPPAPPAAPAPDRFQEPPKAKPEKLAAPAPITGGSAAQRLADLIARDLPAIMRAHASGILINDLAMRYEAPKPRVNDAVRHLLASKRARLVRRGQEHDRVVPYDFREGAE